MSKLNDALKALLVQKRTEEATNNIAPEAGAVDQTPTQPIEGEGEGNDNVQPTDGAGSKGGEGSAGEPGAGAEDPNTGADGGNDPASTDTSDNPDAGSPEGGESGSEEPGASPAAEAAVGELGAIAEQEGAIDEGAAEPSTAGTDSEPSGTEGGEEDGEASEPDDTASIEDTDGEEGSSEEGGEEGSEENDDDGEEGGEGSDETPSGEEGGEVEPNQEPEGSEDDDQQPTEDGDGSTGGDGDDDLFNPDGVPTGGDSGSSEAGSPEEGGDGSDEPTVTDGGNEPGVNGDDASEPGDTGSGEGSGSEGDETFDADAEVVPGTKGEPGTEDDGEFGEDAENPVDPSRVADEPQSEVVRAEQTIEDAREISDKLAEIASVIADRFPASNESGVAEIDPNDPVVASSAIAVSSLNEQTQALAGSADVNIRDSDPLVIGMRSSLASVVTTAKTFAEATAKQIIDNDDAAAGIRTNAATATAEGNIKITAKQRDRLMIGETFRVAGGYTGGIMQRVLATMKHWLRDHYINHFLGTLVKTGETTPLMMPYLADLQPRETEEAGNVAANHHIHNQAQSLVLSGNRVLTYFVDIDESLRGSTKREGRLVMVPATKPTSEVQEDVEVEVPKPGTAELNSVVEELMALNSALEEAKAIWLAVIRVADSLATWLERGTVDEAQKLSVESLLQAIIPVEACSRYSMGYSQALVAYGTAE